jgi:hypothetical protein
MIKVRSSNLDSFDYNQLTQPLSVKFLDNPKIFNYLGVPPNVVDAFATSPSKGKFFHRYIKSKYKLG